MKNVSEKHALNIKTAPVWVLLDQIFGRVFRIAVSVVLARILIPDDFGIYALSLSLLELSRLTGNLGIGTAIVQILDIDDEFLHSAFWLNLSASVFMLFNSVLIGFLGAHFLHVPALKQTVPVLGLTFLSAGYIHVNQSLLVRDLYFKYITQASVLRVIAEGSLSIVLALFGFGYWAFILGFTFGDFINSLVLYRLSEWRPRFKPQFRYPKRYLKFGLNIFLFSLATYLLEQLPNLIIGKVATVYILGLFTFALRQSKWIADVPKMAGKNFLLSALSRVQNLRREFQNYYLLWIRFILVWVGPIFVLQIALAPYYVPFIFGAKWVPAVQGLQLLVIYMFLDVAFFEVHSEGIIAHGQVHRNVVWRFIEAGIVATVLFLVSSKGVTAIAVSMVFVRLFLLPLYIATTSKGMPVGLWRILRHEYLAVLYVLVFSGVTFYYVGTLENGVSLLLGGIYAVFIGSWIALGFVILPETRKLIGEIAARMIAKKSIQLEQI